MRRSLGGLVLRIVAASLSITSAVSVLGCLDEDCRDSLTCEPPEDPNAGACIADPAAGKLEDRCGVFVSSSLGNDESAGTRERPVRSLELAIALAQVGPKRVYACAETFVQPVVLPAGVELWGGLDCGGEWGFLGGDKKTILAPGPNAIPLRVEAGGGTSIVADVRAEAASASVPSGSSIAVMVMPDAAVEILRSQIVAGNGARGANGRDGGNGPAPGGTPGEGGGTACSADTVSGGPAVATTCGSLGSTGGQGGPGNITSGGGGLDGQPVPVPNPAGMGEGGLGATSNSLCANGTDGATGTLGQHGKGGSGQGRLTATGWQGEDGQDGGDGLPGQGGGGGGASRGGAAFCGNTPFRGGASGGSGGAGACGGKGGKGGGYGGASIGLASLGGHVAIRTSSIFTGRGGDAGNGGLLQVGGIGGAAGIGGAGFNLASPGCDGGYGGNGGDGGDGGGGLGGPSVGIAHLFGRPVTQEDVTIQTGEPGHGGLGGNPNRADGNGADGVQSALLAFGP